MAPSSSLIALPSMVPFLDDGPESTSLFASGHVANGDLNAVSGSPAHDFDSKSVTGGVRFVVNEKVLAGVAIGWSEGESDTKSAAMPTNLDVESRAPLPMPGRTVSYCSPLFAYQMPLAGFSSPALPCS